MGDYDADLLEALEEYTGFLAGYRSWYHEQPEDDRPSAEEVLETLTAEYHTQMERAFIEGYREGW